MGSTTTAIDSPQLKADLEKIAAKVSAFVADYRGKLAEMAQGPEASAKLGEAVGRYEALSDRLGRV